MKKTVLFLAVAFLVIEMNAQKVWNLGGDATVAASGAPAFAVSAGIGNGDGTAGNPVWPVNINGLLITGPSATPPAVPNVNMGQVESSSKTFTDANSVAYSFPNRFKFNGGGYSGAADTQTTPTVNMPTQRYISFQVSGNSTIYAIGITGSSSSSRKVFVTDGTTLIGTMDFPAGSVLNDATVNYTGAATTLYMFCNAACNLYYLKATNVILTNVGKVVSNSGVTVKNNEIVNSNKSNLEVYSVLGKKVFSSSENISLKNFQKGIYFVRIAGTKEAIKFSI